jgi:hypothetical protein
MSNVLRNSALALALLAGAALLSPSAIAGSKHRWGNLMYTYYYSHNKPRRAFPQYGPVFRGPGYAYWGPPTYTVGWPYHYNTRRVGRILTIR